MKKENIKCLKRFLFANILTFIVLSVFMFALAMKPILFIISLISFIGLAILNKHYGILKKK